MPNRGDLSSVRPDPRPTSGRGGIGQPKRGGKGRIVADKAQWERLRAAKLGPCYVCRWQGCEQTELSQLHHVVSRARLGDDVPENLVPVCVIHHALVEAHDPVACRDLAAAIQQWDDPVYAYAVSRLGEDRWLARYHVDFGTAA